MLSGCCQKVNWLAAGDRVCQRSCISNWVHLHAVDNGSAGLYEHPAFQARLVHPAVPSVELGRCLQGQVLGCGAHLTALRRESIGEHSVADAWVLSDLADAAREARETQT